MGVMRISFDDFCKMTPSEFDAACTAWNEHRELEVQGEWERMRVLACVTAQPHTKKKLRPHTWMPFPWEHKKKAPEKIESWEERKGRVAELFEKVKNLNN